jgi:hypothetical protein
VNGFVCILAGGPMLKISVGVQAEILARGLPLRAKHVSGTSTDSRAFL